MDCSTKSRALMTLAAGISGAVLALTSFTSAQAATPYHRAPPDWSTKTHNSSSATKKRPAVPAATAAACHGHADAPHKALDIKVKGIGYDAYQDCTGSFGTQSVCIELWYLDYYGGADFVSHTYGCSKETVSSHAYKGSFIACDADGMPGHVKYFTKSTGYAHPPSHPTLKGGGESDDVTLC